MRFPVTLPILLVALASTAASGDGGKEATLKIAKPTAIGEDDTLTVTSKTTFTQIAGKKIKQGTRTGTSTIQVLKVKGGKITRAKVSRDKVETSGALASVVWAPDTFGSAAVQGFGLAFGDLTRAQIDKFCDDMTLAEVKSADPNANIVFDAGDGFTDVMIESIQHHAWLVGGVPFRAAVAGKTFTPGTVLNLGGQDIEIVYGGLTPADWSSLPGGSLSLVMAGITSSFASFALTTTVELLLADGTKVSGELTGKLTIDIATASLRSVVLEGDVSNRDGGSADIVTFHVVQQVTSALVYNES